MPVYLWYILSWVHFIFGTFYLGYSLSLVHFILGTVYLGYSLSWVQFILGTDNMYHIHLENCPMTLESTTTGINTSCIRQWGVILFLEICPIIDLLTVNQGLICWINIFCSSGYNILIGKKHILLSAEGGCIGTIGVHFQAHILLHWFLSSM